MSITPHPDLLAGWTVLVVDDEPDSIEVAQTLLELCGAKVYTAENGQSGLEQVALHQPHFILSDLSMPVMSGWQMLEALQRNPKTKAIPVIALTAHAMLGDRSKALAAGFYNYLSKPLEPETFVYDILHLLIEFPGIAELLEESDL